MEIQKMSRSDAGHLGFLKSRETIRINHEKRIAEYYKNPILCKNCGKPIKYEKRLSCVFCDSSCSATFNNKITKVKERFKCINCGQPLKRNVGKYCSLKCQQSYQWKQEKIFFEENGTFRGCHQEATLRVKYKKYMLEISEKECAVCKIKEWLGKPIPLVFDHIDGNSNNFEMKNLRLICNNCDAMSPTFKGRNKGKGRTDRKK